MSRSWPSPLAGNTIQFVGDLHFGHTDSGYPTATTRNSKMLNDLLYGRVLPPVDARVQIGDYTESAATGEFTEGNVWTNQIPGAWYGVTGNHDLWGVRSSTSAMGLATAWDKNTVNWTQDLGFVQLIGICLSDWTPQLEINQTSLDYLDAQLSVAAKDCVVLCHAPLPDTVLSPDEATEYTSRTGASPEMFIKYDSGATDTLEEVLEANANAKLYVSGHTHSKVSAPDLVKEHDLGSRNILTLNCSATVYVGRPPAFNPHSDPIRSFYVTFKSTGFGDVVEFRVRDHGGRCWGHIGGEKLVTKSVPA